MKPWVTKGAGTERLMSFALPLGGGSCCFAAATALVWPDRAEKSYFRPFLRAISGEELT